MWKFDSRYILNRGVFPMSIVDPDATTIYNRIIADGGVSNLSRLNFFVKGLKAIYGDLANVPVCYDAHWIGYKLGSGTGATAGQAAAKLYSLTVAGDAVQTTAASQPLLLSHNGDNYYFGSGVSGNYVSTPNAAANQITGDIEIYSNVNNAYGISSPVYNIACGIQKGITTNQKSWGLIWQYNVGSANYQLRYVSSNNGTTYLVDNTSSNFIPTSLNFYVKVTHQVDNGSSQNIVKFYYSNDNINFILISTSTNSGAHLRFNSSSLCTVGQGDNTFVNPLRGEIYRATISNSIGGTPVVDFNPATYNAATSQTAWTSTTGEVWTINTGTATSGYKGQLVSKTIVQGDGVDDSIKNTPFVTSANCTDYIAFEQFGWVNGDFVIDGAVVSSIGLQQTTLIPNIRFEGAGGGVGVSNFIVNTLSLATILGTATPGSVNLFRNNTSLLFGGTKADSQGYTLFARGNSTSFSNASINTVIKALGQDDVTIRTATYNFIKSLNNNAF